MALGVFGLMALLGIVVYVATNNGTVQITVDDPDAVIRVDGSTIHIEKIGEPITLTLTAGSTSSWPRAETWWSRPASSP